MPILVPCVIAGTAITSSLFTGAVRAYTRRRGVLDHPNERSSHTEPTPRGGGLALVGTAAAGMLAAAMMHLAPARETIVLAIGMTAVAAIGWIDDRRSVRPALRLGVHVAAAVWTLGMLHGMPSVSIGTSALPLGPLGYVLGVLGIVWSINLFNFMDGIDGIAGSQGVLIFGGAGLLSFVHGDLSLAIIAAILGASTLGFLVWNWPPAKIFMGDVGSGAVGYLIAALAIASERRGTLPLLAFVILYGVFVADATITLIRRVRRGERPADAHRDHAYQRLTRAWNSHARVATLAAVTTCVLAIFAGVGTLYPVFLLPASGGAAALLGVLLIAAERRAPMRSGPSREVPLSGSGERVVH